MKGVKMKRTINPLKWIYYSKLLIEVEKSVRFVYDDINLSNIEIAASTALEALTREAIQRDITVEEFAYILYTMNKEHIAYQAVFSLEMLYGKLPNLEREEIVDRVAEIHYKLASGVFVDEFEYARIYKPTYQRLDLLMPL